MSFQGGGANGSSYGFSSKPRAVGSKRYRKPGLTLMSDRRVVRGTTTQRSPILAPSSNSKQGRVRSRRAEYIPPTKPTIFNLKPEQEDHIPVVLDAFLVEKEKVVAVTDIQTQTDEFEPLPPPAPYVPKKTGIDVSTQVDLDELFDFDLEVGPILDVIVNKTLEQARMEVEEEEELKVIRQQRQAFDGAQAAEKERVLRLEQAQRQKFLEKEERVAREQERVAKEHTVYRKVGSVQLIKAVLSELRGKVYADLEASGYFPDMLEEEVRDDFMPWLYEKAAGIAAQASVARETADDLLRNALETAYARHRNRKCYIRVVVNVGAASHVVGPIVVASGDTVQVIHDRIADWLAQRGTGAEALGGPIRLAYGRPPQPLDASEVLLSIRGLDLNQLHVSVELPEPAEGEEADE